MNKQEECVYRARLAAAASYTRYSGQASSCETLPIIWHGDETDNEKTYVKFWACEGFRRGDNFIKVGDQVFEACMKEKRS